MTHASFITTPINFIKLVYLAALYQKPQETTPLRILVKEKKLNEIHSIGSPFNRDLTALYDQTKNERSSIYEASLDVQNAYEEAIVQTFNIWESKIRKLPSKQNPQATFIAGAMSAGKGYMIAKRFDLLKEFVSLKELENRFDLDEIRKTTYSYEHAASEDKAMKSQYESGVIEDTLMELTIKEKRNFVYDGSMRDAEWFEKIFTFLHQEGYSINLIHVDVEESRLVKQIQERNAKEERQTNPDIAIKSLHEVNNSMKILSRIPGVRYVRIKKSAKKGVRYVRNIT